MQNKRSNKKNSKRSKKGKRKRGKGKSGGIEMENQENEKKEFVPKHYSIVSNILYFVKFFRKYEPIVLICCIIEIILGAALPLFSIYLPKLTVDLIVSNEELKKAIVFFVGFTFFMMAVYGIYSLVSEGKYHFYNEQRTNLIGLLFLKSLRINYGYTEAGEIQRLYWKALDALYMGDSCALSRMVTSVVWMLTSILRFLLYSTVITILSPAMLAGVMILSLLSYFFNICHIRYCESMRDERAKTNRKYWAVVNSMGSIAAAKDVRIFGMHSWLTALRDQAVSGIVAVEKKLSKKRSFYEKLEFVLSFLRDLGAYGFLVYQVVHGRISVSEFVLYFGAITGFSGFIMGIMDSLSALREASNSTDYIRAYMELPEEDKKSGNRHIDELNMPIKIEFQDVSFSYRDMGELLNKRYSNEEDLRERCKEEGSGEESFHKERTKGKETVIFRHLNLTIEAGENIALVGVNGAGKTTFVKLLCGMYEPDSGRILFNGIDRREFPKEELYDLFSVVFQEQLIFPFTVGENLTLSRIENVEEKRAWHSIEQAGLKKVFEEKKIGLKTYMTKQIMKTGIELSGGQQQRFLLARALYKNAPILVLDEPTAALDPIAESEIYQSYSQYSKDKTAVFISHRLASTRFSDRIIMIEDGSILEMGTHQQLMEKNGHYAEMFRVQSRYYEKKKEDC